MTTLEALASRVDVYSIDEAFLDLTGIDRVVSFEPFGRQAIWLKVESPDGYDHTPNRIGGTLARMVQESLVEPLFSVLLMLATDLVSSQHEEALLSRPALPCGYLRHPFDRDCYGS